MNISIDIPNWAFVTIVLIWTAYVILSFVDRYLKHKLEKIKIIEKWVSVDDDFPDLGQLIAVQNKSGKVFYAVYSGEDEFDLHIPQNNVPTDYRSDWYKHSSRTIVKWKSLAPA